MVHELCDQKVLVELAGS